MDQLSKAVGKYSEEWTDMMLIIWAERIERLRVIDTGALHESFSSRVQQSADGSSILMKFYQYGIYVARGVGKGYTKGNGGDLEFLDPEYRRQHKLGPARKARDWFYKKYWRSRKVMVEDLAAITGGEAVKIVCKTLDGEL